MSKSIACIFFSIMLLLGCSSFKTLKGQKRVDSLEFISELYGHDIRFGRFKKASRFLKSDDTGQGKIDFKNLKTIKVSSYDLVDSKITFEGTLAQQTVEIKYYIIDNLIEKTLIDNQLWEFNEDEEFWYLKSGLPEFK